jgi:hypothetical protein
MTDSEKIKLLAEMVLTDNERLDVLHKTINNLIGIMIANDTDLAGWNNRLISDAEQISAAHRDAATWRAETRKVFGLG